MPTRTRALPAIAVATVALLATVLVLLTGGPASAHAAVSSTFPADGAVVDTPPTEVSVTFNEGVDVPTAGVRVYDSAGERVDLGDADVDPQEASRARVSLPHDLEAGTYVVTWRATSADGHPVKGAFVFSVLTDEGVGDDLVEALFTGGEDAVTAGLAVLLRAAVLVGLLLVSGVALFGVVVDYGKPADGRLLRRGAVVTLAATVVALPVQSMLVTGFGPVAAIGITPMADLLGQPFGWSSLLRVGLLGAMLVPGVPGRVRPGLAVGALLTLALDGHSLTQDPIPVIFVGDVVHLLAGAVWGGGLVALGSALRTRRRADDPVGGAALVARFSRTATIALVTVAAAGSAMAYVTVRAPRTLTSTDYGVTLLVKITLVAILALVGLYNMRRLVPAVRAAATVEDPEDRAARIGDLAWQRLSGTVRIEAGLVGAVLLATGLLVGLQPAAQEAGITGAFSTYVSLSDDYELNLVVDPNRAGPNEVHVYVLNATGRVADDVENVRMELEQTDVGVGPIERDPFVAGPGHWTLAGRELSIPGTWQITVHARVGRFEELTATVEVVVN